MNYSIMLKDNKDSTLASWIQDASGVSLSKAFERLLSYKKQEKDGCEYILCHSVSNSGSPMMVKSLNIITENDLFKSSILDYCTEPEFYGDLGRISGIAFGDYPNVEFVYSTFINTPTFVKSVLTNIVNDLSEDIENELEDHILESITIEVLQLQIKLYKEYLNKLEIIDREVEIDEFYSNGGT